MGVRRHIAALALLGVQLLQGILPAAGAACERQTVTMAIARPADAPAHLHHGAPGDAGDAAVKAPAEAPAKAPAPHHAPAACPMAMACTVVCVMSTATSVSTIDVTIDVHRPVHAADWPISLDLAPETPPPRG